MGQGSLNICTNCFWAQWGIVEANAYRLRYRLRLTENEFVHHNVLFLNVISGATRKIVQRFGQ